MAYKNNYHPLIILLYHFNMLTPSQIRDLPKATRCRWNKFSHDYYDLSDWCEDYVAQFDNIKEVLVDKHLYQDLRTMIAIKSGYSTIMNELDNGKKLMRNNAEKVISAIDWIIKYSNISVRKAAKLFGINRDWYYRHHPDKGCKKSPLNLCYKQMPNQLTFEEVGTIDESVNDEQNIWKTKTSIYYELARKGMLFCAKSTFFKYAKILRTIKKPIIPKHKPKSVKATYCFEWLHIDITLVKTIENGLQKVAFVKDNYSGALLHYKSTSGKAGSQFIKEILEEAFKMYNLMEEDRDINILSDGGSENKGEVLDWIETLTAPPIVRKITANTKEFPFSNNMAESTHRTYKSEFMQGKISLNKTEHFLSIKKFVEYYNYYRYPTKLYGLVPLEVLGGEKIDKHKFQKLIHLAQKQRLTENQNFNQCKF